MEDKEIQENMVKVVTFMSLLGQKPDALMVSTFMNLAAQFSYAMDVKPETFKIMLDKFYDGYVRQFNDQELREKLNNGNASS